VKCPTCGHAYVSRRGAQAAPDLVRYYTCAICYRPQVQKGPGRPRQICTERACNRKAQRLRRIPA
jgi:hypothetical protein